MLNKRLPFFVLALSITGFCTLHAKTKIAASPDPKIALAEPQADTALPPAFSDAATLANWVSLPFIQTAKTATPCVVSITAEQGMRKGFSRQPFDYMPDDFFERFFGCPMPHQQRRPGASFGSGFLTSADGYILTNYHVVRDAERIRVRLNDGSQKELEAQLIGSDPSTDLAVLKVEKAGDEAFPFLSFASSEDVQVGQWVIAIGAPYRIEATVTHGIISAKGRQDLKISDFEDFLQTDAPINPGNSGGPLLNLHGRVVGINTAIASQTGSSVGISFAIPSQIAQNVMHQLIETGSVTRGYLGVVLQPVDTDVAKALGLNNESGVVITEVVKESPAADAGLKPGDVILKINGETITSLNKLRNMISLTPPGSDIALTIFRQGKNCDVKVTLRAPQSKSVKLSGSAAKLGFEVADLSPETIKAYHLSDQLTEGAVITSIKAGSLAQKAGMTPGMVILMANHQKIKNSEDLLNALKNLPSEGSLLFLVTDNSKASRFIVVKLE